jgi:hypothetical protein
MDPGTGTSIVFVRESDMLGKCVCVASAYGLCFLLVDFRPQPANAGESQAASILVVPVPVPATRRAAIAPPPPPVPEIDPIEKLAGRWSGEGTMVPTSGRNEQFRCVITYQVAEEASRVRQHLRCQGDNRNFDAITRLDIDENKVTGVWADNVYSISGTLHGNVTDKGFNIQLRSAYFDAKMSVVSSDCQQIVKLIPNDSSVGMKELAATLKKC